MFVTVSERDQHEAHMLALDTVKLLESMGVAPRLENKKQSRIDANRFGFMAEFAVARVFGAGEPRLNIATDGGVDLWLDDISVDVKYTKTRLLIFDSLEKFKAKVAILVTHRDLGVMEIIGWMGKKDFERVAIAKDFGYGERMVAQAEDLRPIETLWGKIQERKFA